MYAKNGDCASFERLGIPHRHTFNHYAVIIPKAYPDSRLVLERRGVSDRVMKTGTFYQLNLYTTDFHQLPEALFTDHDVNWHNQQFGQKGLIAAAGLWVRDSRATITLIQSDVCQQLYRHRELRRSCKTRVESRFKYWYRFLLNAVLDACLDADIATLYSPTSQQIVSHITKCIKPDLFLRIYDSPEHAYQCRRIVDSGTEYWEVPLKPNAARIVRLRRVKWGGPSEDGLRKICIVHDIEGNVDTAVSALECWNNLERMLRLEKELGVSATYCILGRSFHRARNVIIDFNHRHAIGFHSMDHDLANLNQLLQCREVDLRVRGYRPPKSRITNELSDENLAYHNFEWLASSVYSFGHNDCILRNGIVKIPIHVDDYHLFTGCKDYLKWKSALCDRAGLCSLFGVGLHDCYAGKWLEYYPELLSKLALLGKFVTADEVCDEMYLQAVNAIAPRGILGRMARWWSR